MCIRDSWRGAPLRPGTYPSCSPPSRTEVDQFASDGVRLSQLIVLLWNELILGVHAHNPLPLVTRVHTSLAILLVMTPETLSQVRISLLYTSPSPRDHSMFRC